MGKCTYCGSGAGFLKDHHPECKQKNVDGWGQMVALSGDAVVRDENVDSLPAKLAEVARASYIPESQCVPAIVAGWGQALDRFLDDSLLSESEYRRLVGVADRLGIRYEELNVNGAYDRAEKAKILTDLSQGQIPTQDIKGELPST